MADEMGSSREVSGPKFHLSPNSSLAAQVSPSPLDQIIGTPSKCTWHSARNSSAAAQGLPSPVDPLSYPAQVMGTQSRMQMEHSLAVGERTPERSPSCKQSTTSEAVHGAHQPSPMEMLVQGTEQKIHIPLKTILEEVMKKMPAKEPPVFKCTKYGEESYEVSVQLNVTGSRVTVEPTLGVVTLLGEVSNAPQLSLISAVKKAFEYLEKKHFVQVHDYSSKVVDSLVSKRVFVDVNSVGYNIDKVLADWIVVINSVGKFQSHLESNVNFETTHGVISPAGEIYEESKNFIQEMVSKYLEKHRAMYFEYMQLEGKRAKYLREANDKVNKCRMKCFRQSINLSEKLVLSSVLHHLCLKAPEYYNTPDEYGQFSGEVIINLPFVEDARCGGRIKFHGGMRSSSPEAEESAAWKSLRYMEANLNLTIVDINYAKRLEGEAKHDQMVKLLRDMVRLGRKVLNCWANMNDHMNAGVDIFGGDRLSFTMAPLSPFEVAAVKYCQDGFVKVRGECTDGYAAASTKLKCLDEYNSISADYDN